MNILRFNVIPTISPLTTHYTQPCALEVPQAVCIIRWYVLLQNNHCMEEPLTKNCIRRAKQTQHDYCDANAAIALNFGNLKTE